MKLPNRALELAPSDAEEILRSAGVSLDASPRVEYIKSGNRVFELSAGTERYFIKFPAKDFVESVDPVIQAGTRVLQEWAAWGCLRLHGLPGIDVVAMEQGSDNPCGWPYLLTRQLNGIPLADYVRSPLDRDWMAAMKATGEYLGAAHSIKFDEIGFILTPDGPALDPAGRLFGPVHDPAKVQAAALRDLARARPFLEERLAQQLEKLFASIGDAISGEYASPAFVHTAFHINHPHIDAADGRARVTGVVDLDGASSGAPFEDLVTLAVGMMIQSRDVVWWEPFFDGYGTIPDLERFRLALLADCFYCFGEETAVQDVQSTYAALLAAGSWAELFTGNRAPR